MTDGVRIALDWGRVRIGVAASDATGTLAYPVATYGTSPAEVTDLVRYVVETAPTVVYLGLPRTLSGADGPAALAIRDVGGELSGRLAPIPVRLVDERLTTVVAHRALAETGKRAKQRRRIVDQAAAVAILEQALLLERRSGDFAGEPAEGSAS